MSVLVHHASELMLTAGITRNIKISLRYKGLEYCRHQTQGNLSSLVRKYYQHYKSMEKNVVPSRIPRTEINKT